MLIDLCKGKPEYGSPFSGKENGKYRFTRITDIDDMGRLKTEKKAYVDEEGRFLKKNDLVIARTGNDTGRAYLYNPEDGPMVFGSFLIRFPLDDKKVVPEFLRYYTQSDSYKKWINDSCLGSTRKGMGYAKMGRMPIPDFSLEKQREIAEQFDLLFDAVRNAEELIRFLWKEIQTVFDKMQVSNIGKMKDLFTLHIGNAKPGNGTIPLYTSAGIYGTSNDQAPVTESVIIPEAGSLQNLFYVNSPFCAGSTVYYAEMKRKHTALYAYLCLKEYDLSLLDTGSVIPGITSDSIYRLKCRIPDDKQLSVFHKMTYGAESQIRILEEKIKILKKMIKTLLKAVFG